MSVSKENNALLRFLQNYGEDPGVQSNKEAMFDSQIKSIFLSFLEQIAGSNDGVIIDIGCGEGIFFNRLAKDETFQSKSKWIYFGTDYSENVEMVAKEAFNRRLNRRVELSTLEEFYNKWPQFNEITGPQLILTRNVLHELNIEETSKLLSHVTSNMRDHDIFYIQDLAVFPEAEKGNACWDIQILCDLLCALGLTVIKNVEPSRSGNIWFNLIASPNAKLITEADTIKQNVIEARKRQWVSWSDLGPLAPDDAKYRDVQISKIDFDLQYASLTRMLIAENEPGVRHLTKQQETIVIGEALEKALMNFSKDNLPVENYQLVPIEYFVDRGNSIAALNKYVAGEDNIAVIYGPKFMGKTVLINRVLSKLAHGKFVIIIRPLITSSVWNIIEQIFSQINCRLPFEILVMLKSIRFDDVKKIICEILSEISDKVIFVIDNFELLIGNDRNVSDPEIGALIKVIVEFPGAKVIIGSRVEINANNLGDTKVSSEKQPMVGRFPKIEQSHVAFLLNHFLGLVDYPEEILDAIDNHPFLAFLAAIWIRKHGIGQICDASLLEELRSNLRSEIIQHIIDDSCSDALKILSQVRIPIPATMVENLSSNSSLSRAYEYGLIVSEKSRIWGEIIRSIGAMRIRLNDSDSISDYENDDNPGVSIDENTRKIHSGIKAEYLKCYRKDNDPRWLRECFYHSLVCGEINKATVGSTVKSEIWAAGEYWFIRFKDYKQALWAFNTVSDLGEQSVLCKMRIAACLIRTDDIDKGTSLFFNLIEEYPTYRNIKSSLIDSLIYIHMYQYALDLLNEYGMKINDDPWTAGQFGRAYLGLQDNALAIKAFEVQMKLEKTDYVFKQLAKAYHHIGDRENEIRVLEAGIRWFSNSHQLKVSYAACLERRGQVKQSLSILEELLKKAPNNGWIAYPYIKCLIKSDKLQEAIDFVEANESHIRPIFMRTNIKAELLLGQGKYKAAINKIGEIDRNDENKVGQIKELYYQWAINCGDQNEAISIANEGLNIKYNKILENNIPILVINCKLCLVANEYDRYLYYIEKIHSINPNVPDLEWLLSQGDAVFAI